MSREVHAKPPATGYNDGMQKLSPRYRHDEAEGLPDDIRQYLDRHFLKTLDNLDVPHPKLLVVFSGGNAVGKSTLAQHIKQELKALVLENDGMKQLLKAHYPDKDRDELNKLTWQYSMELYARLDQLTSNGLVVRDGVIDWYYDRILPVFERQGYKLFIIAYDLSDKKRVELIKKRGDKATVNVDRLIMLIEDHRIHTKRFLSHHTPDFVFHDDDLFDCQPVIARLKARLRQA